MLAFKQITKQMGKNRLFLLLLFLLCTLTSASFFFVRFCIDGNVNRIPEILAGGGDAARYRAALASNTTLANVFLLSTVSLTAFVFFLFFYRFTRANKKQFGCLKSLGYTDHSLRLIFVGFSFLLGVLGDILGLAAAHPLSQVLINANMRAYGVTGLKRAVNSGSLVTYFLFSLGTFTLVAFFSYCLIKGREPGVLLASNANGTKNTRLSRFATRIAEALPVKNKLALRIMLRKPVILLLLLSAVMVFSTFILMSYSINLSSGQVMASQTNGHQYSYVTAYSSYLPGNTTPNGLPLLQSSGLIHLPENSAENTLESNITALTVMNDLLILKDLQGAPLMLPPEGSAIIGKELYEVYDVRPGDILHVELNKKSLTVTVAAIAQNAQANTLYVNGNALAGIMGLQNRQYNLLLSAEEPSIPGETQTREERIALLEREAVSNKASAVINQVIGAFAGGVLLLLALFMAFQDNMRDMLLLRMMGHSSREIRKMFIDVYRPFVWVCFAVMLAPSLLLVKNIMRSLSITTGDYMPFTINFFSILILFLIINCIFQLVLWLLEAALNKAVKEERIQEYICAE